MYRSQLSVILHSRPHSPNPSCIRRGLGTRVEGPFHSRAKAPLAKGSENGYGDENGFFADNPTPFPGLTHSHIACVIWFLFLGSIVPKRLFKYGEERPVVRYCTQEEKLNFESFTQNGCYGNQPQPPEVVFYSIDANTSCSFTKQDMTDCQISISCKFLFCSVQ